MAAPALPPLAAERAALLACGDGAMISHHSAAMWRIRRSLELAFDEALVRGLMTLAAIEGVTARYPNRPGAARLQALARPDRATTVTRSEAEERFLAMIRRAHLPDPEVNARLGRFVADFLWRDERVLVEIDGYD